MEPISTHIYRQYNAELEEVRTRVLEMGGLVEQQVERAVRALVTGDSELAEQVIYDDTKVNSLEVQIDEDCSEIIARRQPAAGDLRFIIAVIKTITDLERMGDEADRIARMAMALSQREPPADRYSEIRHLGEMVRRLAHDALDAYARTDVQAALEVRPRDRQIDQEYESIYRQMITFMMEDPRSIPRTLDVLWAARALERIADRSCNICEYVIYMVKGRDVRHLNWDQVRAEMREQIATGQS
jgi:phosphate transport system protein